jgi:hypothetical protein
MMTFVPEQANRALQFTVTLARRPSQSSSDPTIPPHSGQVRRGLGK